MGHIFISYSRKDEEYVNKLVDALENEGFEVWIDRELLTGDTWTQVINHKIDTCDAFVIVMTDSSKESNWVRREVLYAIQEGKKIFPLLLEGKLWMLLQDFNCFKVTDGSIPNRKFFSDIEKTVPRSETWLTAQREAIEKAAHEKAEKEAAEKARIKADEEERQRIAKAKAERKRAEMESREKTKKEAAEKARVKAEEEERQRIAKEKAEREEAENVAREKAEAVSVKELPLAIQDRILEAAIQKQVVVDKPASLYVWIKRSDSKSIISVVNSNIDENVVLDENNIKSTGLEIEFPIEQGKVTNASISLKLVAPEFSPSTQQKEIKIPVTGDSEVCTFLVTPKKTGKLLLNIEVLKDKVSVANRNLWTMAIGTETQESSPMLLVTIPIFVIVQPKQDVININGNVSDSVIVSGDHNAVNAEKAILESEKLARQKAEREAAEKVYRELVEKEAAEKTRLNAEEQFEEKMQADKKVIEKVRLDGGKQETSKITETYTKIKPWIAYGVAVSISLFFSVLFILFLAFPTVAQIRIFSFQLVVYSFIFYLVLAGIWLVVTYHRLAFFLSYTVLYFLMVLAAVINSYVNNVIYGFEAILPVYFGFGFFVVFLAFFLLKISETKNFLYKILFCCVADVVTIIVILGIIIGSNISNIDKAFIDEIYNFLPVLAGLSGFLAGYFLFCSFFGNWLRRVLKNRLTILFAKN